MRKDSPLRGDPGCRRCRDRKCVCHLPNRPECDHKIIDGEFARQLATAARKGEIDRFSCDMQREEKGKSTFLTNWSLKFMEPESGQRWAEINE